MQRATRRFMMALAFLLMMVGAHGVATTDKMETAITHRVASSSLHTMRMHMDAPASAGASGLTDAERDMLSVARGYQVGDVLFTPPHDVDIFEDRDAQQRFDDAIDMMLQTGVSGGDAAGWEWLKRAKNSVVSGVSNTYNSGRNKLRQAGAAIADAHETVVEHVSDATEAVVEHVSEKIDRAGAAIDRTAERAGELIDSAGEAISDAADATGEFVRDGYEMAKTAVIMVGDTAAVTYTMAHIAPFFAKIISKVNFEVLPESKVKDGIWGEFHFISDIVFPLVFGFIDGLLIGLGSFIRNAIRDSLNSEHCKTIYGKIGSSFKSVMDNVVDLVKGIFLKDVRGEHSRVEWVKARIGGASEAFGELMAALWELVTTCPGIRTLMITLIVMVSVTVVIVLGALLLPPAWAFLAKVKVVGMILTVVFAAKFLYETIKRAHDIIQKCYMTDGEEMLKVCTRDKIIEMVEIVGTFAGLIFTAIFLSGLEKIVPWLVQKIGTLGAAWNSSRLSARLGIRMNGTFIKALEGVHKIFMAIKGKNSVEAGRALNDATSLARAQMAAAKPAGIADDVARVADDVARTTDDTAAIVDDAAAAFTKEGGGLHFDANVNRWRETATGRFHAKPNKVYWDSKVGRWRDPVTGRFAQAPAAAGTTRSAASVTTPKGAVDDAASALNAMNDELRTLSSTVSAARLRKLGLAKRADDVEKLQGTIAGIRTQIRDLRARVSAGDDTAVTSERIINLQAREIRLTRQLLVMDELAQAEMHLTAVQSQIQTLKDRSVAETSDEMIRLLEVESSLKGAVRELGREQEMATLISTVTGSRTTRTRVGQLLSSSSDDVARVIVSSADDATRAIADDAAKATTDTIDDVLREGAGFSKDLDDVGEEGGKYMDTQYPEPKLETPSNKENIETNVDRLNAYKAKLANARDEVEREMNELNQNASAHEHNMMREHVLERRRSQLLHKLETVDESIEILDRTLSRLDATTGRLGPDRDVVG